MPVISKILKFADDTKIVSTVKSVAGVQVLQLDLQTTFERSRDWQNCFLIQTRSSPQNAIKSLKARLNFSKTVVTRHVKIWGKNKTIYTIVSNFKQ